MAAGRLIAAGSAASKSRPSCERLIPVGLLYTMGSVTTAWARHAGQLVVEPRCRSASLSIGYAMAIHKPMAVGGTRVVGSGMRVGRPAGGSVVAAPDGATQERLVPRRVVVGNLGYDVSFTLPKSYSLLAFRPRGHCRRRGGRLHRGGGRTFGWLEASAPTGMRGHDGDGQSAATVA